jgi:hypothetical protein
VLTAKDQIAAWMIFRMGRGYPRAREYTASLDE